MMVPVEKLLVLKAFYLGYAISEKKYNISIALDMTNAAIEKFMVSENIQDKTRLLFYLLLKAEILRGTPEIIEIRKQAKQISRQISSSIFDYFMAIEDSTQSKKKVYGMHIGLIADEGVKHTVCSTMTDGFNVWTVSYDAACKAVGIDERKLNDREKHFLKKVTLKEMLEKHGVNTEI